MVERGEDVRVFGESGRGYLDGAASLWYANAGHGRPEIAAAVNAQMARLETFHVFGDFATRPALELADRLAWLAPEPDVEGDSDERRRRLDRHRGEARPPLPQGHAASRRAGA